MPGRARTAVTLAFLVALAACSQSTPEATAPTPTTHPLAQVTSLLALGDSVPYGTACNCTPYPGLTGNELATRVGHPIDNTNDAVPGDTSANVLQDVTENAGVIEHVTHANAFELEVGANDVAYSSGCGNDAACYEAKIPAVEKNLDAIVARLHSLTAPNKIGIVLLDYWSAWLGGTYAQEQGPAYVEAADAVTASLNATISAVAQRTGSRYVDLRTAFRGPDDAWDETHLLASDGEHPNAAGHQRIAEAVAATLSAG